jgi:membrane protein
MARAARRAGALTPMTRRPPLSSGVRDAFRRWSEARCGSRAAALAFYAVFSLAPILVIIVAVGSIAVEATALRSSLLAQIDQLVGDDGVRLVTAMLDSAGARPRCSAGATCRFLQPRARR